jgi:hypothetical protein
MRTRLFVLLAIFCAASSVYREGSTRIPIADNGDGNHLRCSEDDAERLRDARGHERFRVISTQRRKPKPPTPPPGQVSLAWDLDNDSAVVGYNLYYTTNPTALTQAMHPPIPGTADKISGMSTTTTTLKGLSSGAVFYFGLTAYNANGVESVLSNVVSTPVP